MGPQLETAIVFEMSDTGFTTFFPPVVKRISAVTPLEEEDHSKSANEWLQPRHSQVVVFNPLLKRVVVVVRIDYAIQSVGIKYSRDVVCAGI